MMSSTFQVQGTSNMGQKSKKIFAKRFDDDFERVCKEMGLTAND